MADSERMAVFIDGSSLYYSAKALGLDIDFLRLLTEFGTRGFLVRAYYYATISDGDEFQSTRPLIDWLGYNGYAVRTKPAKHYDDVEGRRKPKCNIAVELAVDAIEAAKRVDRMVLFTGDGDFRALVEAIQRRGVHVTIVSTLRTKPPIYPTSCAGRRTHLSIWRILEPRLAGPFRCRRARPSEVGPVRELLFMQAKSLIYSEPDRQAAPRRTWGNPQIGRSRFQRVRRQD